MYIYLRVDVPLHRGTDRIVSKYVLVTWQGDESEANGFNSDDEVDMWFGSSSGESTPRDILSVSSSKLQRAITAHVHGSDIYRVFPHHVSSSCAVNPVPIMNCHSNSLKCSSIHQVHFFASGLSEISEESIRDRVRRAVDNDCMLLRVVSDADVEAIIGCYLCLTGVLSCCDTRRFVFKHRETLRRQCAWKCRSMQLWLCYGKKSRCTLAFPKRVSELCGFVRRNSSKSVRGYRRSF